MRSMSEGMYQTTLFSVDSPPTGPPELLQPAKAITITDKRNGAILNVFWDIFIGFLENGGSVMNLYGTKLRDFFV
jgi:hypothetical protein